MVTTFFPPYSFGGDGTYVEQLSLELARRGHEVHVVHCADAYLALEPKGPRRGATARHPNLTVHTLKSRGGILSPLVTQQTGRPGLKDPQLRELLEGSRWDVIHYHNISLMGATALGYGSAIKLYTIHEYWLICPMHVLWKFDREVCEEKACVRCMLHGKRPPQLWRSTGLLDRCLRHVDRFLCGAQFTAEKHREAGLDLPFVHLPALSITDGDADGTDPPRHPAAGDGPYFLAVGRLEKIKGFHAILPVFRRRPDYRLLIAGEGSYASQLREIAGGAPNIRFLGHLSRAELRALYRGATAVVISSLTFEVAPLVAIEAFHEGTPVIARELGSLMELTEGRGLLFRDEPSLEAALDRLATDTVLRDRLGRNAQAAARETWSRESHFAQYFAIIDELRTSRAMAARSATVEERRS
jgi:glycosyltransferase involved in cell wall biosynthesis